MAGSERKRLVFTAIAVALVGIVTGLFLGGALLPSQAADRVYNETTTTTTTETSVVHAHDGIPRHEHTITTVTTTTETTPHGWFHDLASTITPTTPPPTTTTPAAATEPGVHEIKIYWGMLYKPYYLVVPVGSTVTFRFVGGYDTAHPLGFTPSDIDWDITSEGRDILQTATFAEPGTVTYYCAIHGVSGTLVIE